MEFVYYIKPQPSGDRELNSQVAMEYVEAFPIDQEQEESRIIDAYVSRDDEKEELKKVEAFFYRKAEKEINAKYQNDMAGTIFSLQEKYKDADF